MTWFTNISNYS